MKEQNLNNIVKIIDSFGLITIGITSICYIVFSNRFAEYLVQFSFLDFPIFVGEIIIFLCLLLFFLKFKLAKIKLNKWHYILMIYFAFVVTKALYGYVRWGPLAFRDAALMYYPVFAVFCYFFYRKDFFKGEHVFFITAMAIILTIQLIRESKIFFWSLSISLLAIIFTHCYSNKKLKGYLIILVLICAPYELMFLTPRMMLVSNIAAELFLVVLFVIIWKLKKPLKILVIGISFLLIYLGISAYSDPIRAKSIISVQKIINRFNTFDARVQKEIKTFKMAEPQKINLYSPEGVQIKPSTIKIYKEYFERRNKESIQLTKSEHSEEILSKPLKNSLQVVHNSQNSDSAMAVHSISEEKTLSSDPTITQRPVAKSISEEKAPSSDPIVIQRPVLEISDALDKIEPQQELSKYGYNLTTGLNNAVFRLLIWRDMIVELMDKKPILGFDFGLPLRSISLEILYWGWNDWGLNGWVPPHNSFLNIIYRTGILGITFIATLFIILFRMVKGFIKQRSIVGILLCGVIINWLVAANFLLILEAPYSAIPVWSIFGITLAYFHEQKRLSL